MSTCEAVTVLFYPPTSGVGRFVRRFGRSYHSHCNLWIPSSKVVVDLSYVGPSTPWPDQTYLTYQQPTAEFSLLLTDGASFEMRSMEYWATIKHWLNPRSKARPMNCVGMTLDLIEKLCRPLSFKGQRIVTPFDLHRALWKDPRAREWNHFLSRSMPRCSLGLPRSSVPATYLGAGDEQRHAGVPAGTP